LIKPTGRGWTLRELAEILNVDLDAAEKAAAKP
jgi:hypothetical protein